MRLLFVGLAFAATAMAQDKPPAGSAERGKAAFMKYQCYTCHGTLGQGGERGAGPKLAPNPFPWAGFAHQVRAPRQDMPAYRTQQLPDQDLADIYAYVLTLKPQRDAKGLPALRFE